MKFNFKKLTVRQKVTISSFLLSLLIFFLISPLGSILVSLVTPPKTVKNIFILSKNNEIEISYSQNKEVDFSAYIITLKRAGTVEKEILTQETRVLISDISDSVEYDLEIKSKDKFGLESSTVATKVTPSFELDSQTLNSFDRDNTFDFYLISNVLVVVVVGSIFSFWIVGFNQNKQVAFTIILFPVLTVMPILLFISSVSFYINHIDNKFYFSTLSSVGLFFVFYFLFLTMNILFNAHFRSIPLEQAAKASQFIFILISTYILLIYAFGSNVNFIFKIGLVSLMIFYFSYVSMWTLKEISTEQITIRSLVMVMIMVMSVVIFSIWPVNYIYAMLSSAIIFYIMLSISLEVRTFLGRYVWLEYGILVLLTTLLLLFTSSWGINGSLII
ncbi:MAG: hypothetical protein KatS3mg086_212 [Candidatus Dojkabacteria bacterium]|nr:MAG: hypothetical protein KatS3mg086_212 [Candidatus Dojkabacteria bacterium]